ncbi:uncharacterized protein LY89DRAFT_670538 [Mollisia scopiformis]|uniref:Uncharacterized protein n=1 Tax=Mollisia scopiformis TaxID=149040 RepID=A0A194X764_MOLSC|nr:uncharacterized protein LY89DRAFT_670538 [Mollisia scopiformis]KUJ16013.1 hypothetical protein LY89DRAFT_670538 [Mollisia scopiformis]
MSVPTFIASTATTATPSPSMVCHPYWPKYDMHNYPPLPAWMIIWIVFGVAVVQIALGLLVEYLTARGILERLRNGPYYELDERIRKEAVAIWLEPARPGDREYGDIRICCCQYFLAAGTLKGTVL